MARPPLEVKVIAPEKTVAERISSYVPILISVLAIAVSISSAYETRKHDRLGVKPYVHFDTKGAHTDNEVGLFIENTGLGPAIMSNFTVYLDGKKMGKGSQIVWELVETRLSELYSTSSKWPHYRWFDDGYVLKAGESKDVFSSAPADLTNFDAFNELFSQRLFVSVRVCSLYDECYDVCSGGEHRCEDK